MGIQYESMQWQDDALCRQHDPELFFPVKQTVTAIEEAKAVCRQCPVISECGTYALKTRTEEGIWGGLSEDERRAILGRQALRQAG